MKSGYRKILMLGICGVMLCMILTGCSVNKKQDQYGQQAEEHAGNSVADASEIEIPTELEYTEEYEQEVNDSIQSISTLATGESINYIFLTDLHLDGTEERDNAVYRQLYAAVEIANKSDIDFICIGGDIDDGRFAAQDGKQTAMHLIENVSTILQNCTKPVFMVKGNHDDNSFVAQIDPDLAYDADYCISREEWYSVTMAHFEKYTMDYQNGYYYYDLPNKNVRVVVLNMSDNDDTVVDGKRKEIGIYNYQYSREQMNWILNKAMTRQDCEYVFLSHDAFDYGTDYSDSDQQTSRDTIQQILKAAYTHTMFTDHELSMDFTNWTGKVQLLHHGHLHFERATVSEDTGNLPIISTDMARPTASRATETGNGKEKQMQDLTSSVSEYVDRFISKGYRRILARDLGTIDEALFDIVVNRPDTVDVIRFGNGDDLHVDKK